MEEKNIKVQYVNGTKKVGGWIFKNKNNLQLLAQHYNRQHRWPRLVQWETLRRERHNWRDLIGSRSWCYCCPTDPPCPYKAGALVTCKSNQKTGVMYH